MRPRGPDAPRTVQNPRSPTPPTCRCSFRSRGRGGLTGVADEPDDVVGHEPADRAGGVDAHDHPRGRVQHETGGLQVAPCRIDERAGRRGELRRRRCALPGTSADAWRRARRWWARRRRRRRRPSPRPPSAHPRPAGTPGAGRCSRTPTAPVHQHDAEGAVKHLGKGERGRCGPARDAALAALHARLLRIAGNELHRRSGRHPIAGPELDDLAHQAADDALLAITTKLGQFRGESRFTTWAYRFVILEVSAKLGRHFWRRPAVALDAQSWDRLPDRLGLQPEELAFRNDLIAAVRRAVEDDATGAEAACRYPGVAAHLLACGPCAEDVQGLLLAVRADPAAGR